jgi:ribosomal-protein-alanine N-acetyltransferase
LEEDNPMEIETGRLLLRDYRIEDWERVHIYGAEPIFSKYESWGPNTIEGTQRFIADMVAQSQTRPRYKFDLAVCLKDSALLIGGCGIRREAPESAIATLGWAVNPSFQAKGYATEAAMALIRYGFTELGLSIIVATCDVRNTASFKVMEKLGMKRVGLLEKERQQKGIMRDTLRYEISK